jgi:hypothetical protein
MIDLDQVRTLLLDMNLSRVSEATGLPYGRIYRLTHRPEQQPSYETVSKVTAYLESRQLSKVA